MSRCGNDRRPGCGREIDWGIDPDGKRIPLTRGAPIYVVEHFDKESGAYAVRKVEPGSYRVSHFATCPNASNFSASAPKRNPAEGA